MPADISSASATLNADDTITVTWSLTSGTDPSSFTLYERDGQHGAPGWSVVSDTISGTSRSYQTSAKADGQDGYKYRVEAGDGYSTAETGVVLIRGYAYDFSKELRSPLAESTAAVSGSGSGDGTVSIPAERIEGFSTTTSHPSGQPESAVTDGSGGSGSVDFETYKSHGFGTSITNTSHLSNEADVELSGSGSGTGTGRPPDELQLGWENISNLAGGPPSTEAKSGSGETGGLRWLDGGNWDIEKRQQFSIIPEAIAGEGTALAVLSNSTLGLIEGGEQTQQASGSWNFGVPISDRTAIQVADTEVAWPVTIKQSYALQISDPDLVKKVDVETNYTGSCDVKTEIDKYETVKGGIVFNVVRNVNCPPGETQEDEEIETKITAVPTEEAVESNTSGGERVLQAKPETAVDSEGAEVGQITTPEEQPGDSEFESDTTQRDSDSEGSPVVYPPRSVTLGDACAEGDSSGSVSIGANIEQSLVGGFELRISYDAEVLTATGVRGGTGPFSPQIDYHDVDNGFIVVSADASRGYNYGLIEEAESRLGVLDVEAIGNNGEKGTLMISSESRLTSDTGGTIGGVDFGEGSVTVSGGYELPTERAGFGEQVSYTVGIVGPGVAEHETLLTFPTDDRFTIDGVSGEDIPVDSWEVSEGMISVSGSGSETGRDPELFTINLTAYKPTTEDEVIQGPTAVEADGELSTLKDASGAEIETGCRAISRLSIKSKVEVEQSKDGLEVPETGVVYWPIIMPITMEIRDAVNTDELSGGDVQTLVTSATNPVEFTRYSTEIAPSGEPNTVRVEGTLKISKADPQEYPVKFNALMWIGGASAGPPAGAGLVLDGDTTLGGSVQKFSGRVILTSNKGGTSL